MIAASDLCKPDHFTLSSNKAEAGSLFLSQVSLFEVSELRPMPGKQPCNAGTCVVFLQLVFKQTNPVFDTGGIPELLAMMRCRG